MPRCRPFVWNCKENPTPRGLLRFACRGEGFCPLPGGRSFGGPAPSFLHAEPEPHLTSQTDMLGPVPQRQLTRVKPLLSACTPSRPPGLSGSGAATAAGASARWTQTSPQAVTKLMLYLLGSPCTARTWGQEDRSVGPNLPQLGTWAV